MEEHSMMCRYACSYLMALAVTVLIGVVSWARDSSAMGALLLPGIILANIPFPGFAHSGAGPVALFVTVGLMEAFVLSWPVLLLWNKLSPRGRSIEPETGNPIRN
jgi:hypothetical protein